MKRRVNVFVFVVAVVLGSSSSGSVHAVPVRPERESESGLAVIELKYVNAVEMVDLIKPVYATHPRLTIAADVSTNRVVVCAEPDVVRDIRKLMQDVEDQSTPQRQNFRIISDAVAVIELKNANAVGVVDLIKQVYATHPRLTIAASVLTNRVVVSAEPDVVRDIKQLTQDVEAASSVQRNNHRIVVPDTAFPIQRLQMQQKIVQPNPFVQPARFGLPIRGPGGGFPGGPGR